MLQYAELPKDVLTSQWCCKPGIELQSVYAAIGVTPAFPDRFSCINCVGSSKIVSPRL